MAKIANEKTSLNFSPFWVFKPALGIVGQK